MAKMNLRLYPKMDPFCDIDPGFAFPFDTHMMKGMFYGETLLFCLDCVHCT